ncbi:MAG: TonB-dependent receptor [Porticoccaceae bacterium]|nr:TonB-dependent receptor [Porticoccaceae bacterium]
MNQQKKSSNKLCWQHVRCAALVAAVSAALTPVVANAQDGVKGLEEIVVTAQKRAQNAMDTPLSLTALDGDSLKNRQVATMEDLRLVSPGLRSGNAGGVNRLFIRGIGLQSFASGADPSAAFYVDGVFIGRPSFQLGSFFDVDRVEVVRGPQGTLYGRNATSGAVNLHSRRPTEELSGYLEVTAGNYQMHETSGAISSALDSEGKVLGRLAFHQLNRDGYGDDVTGHHPVNDANQQSARGTLQFLPTDDVDITIIGEYHKEKDNNYFTTNHGAYPGFTLAGLQGAANPANGWVPAGIAIENSHDAATNLFGDTNNREVFALTALANVDLTDTFSLASTTGWRKGSRTNANNSDGTSAGLGNTFYNEDNEQFSQELQLTYTDDRLDAVAGVFYYEEEIENYVYVPFYQFSSGPGDTPVPYEQDGVMDIEAWAVFSQATYAIQPDLRLTLGARYSRETREHQGQFTGLFVPVYVADEEKTWSSFTPKVGIEYDLFDNTLLYASWTKGFKSGTYNVGQNNPVIDPEEIKAYEVGFKSQLWDNRLELTGAGFFYDYTDLQVNKIIGIATVTTNAGEAENKGIELATRAQLTDRLMLDANFTWLDATFTEFTSINPINEAAGEQDLRGNMLPGAPEYSAGIGLSYEIPLASGAFVIPRVDATYTDQVFFSEFNDPYVAQDSVTKVNASIRYESADGKLNVTAWGKNITDEYVITNISLGIGLWGLPLYGGVEAPATYGVTLGYNF